jgi:hypothetical protein
MAGYGVVGYVGMKCRKLAVWGGVGMWMWCCVGCVRFGCEGLVVFLGGCVVFWCSFWVGFWLSESLRGVFTPARNGRLQAFREGRGLIEQSVQSGQRLQTAYPSLMGVLISGIISALHESF